MASIEKNVNKKGGVTYKIIVSNGYDTRGKKIRKIKTFKPDPYKTELQNKKELERVAFEFEQSVINGRYLDGEKITLAELADKWYKEYVIQRLTAKTQEQYKYYLERYIVPALGHLKTAQIKPLHIQEFYNHLKNDNVRLDGKSGGFSKATIQKINNVLSGLLHCAVNWQIIDTNPCERVNVPNYENTITKSDYFTPEQAILFLNALEMSYPHAVKGHKRIDDTGKAYYVGDYTEKRTVPLQFKVLFNIALFGGLRKGELLGLTFNDVDFDKNTVSINKSVSYANKQTIIKEPKTKTSIRVVTLPETVISLIFQLKQEQAQKQLKYGDRWNNPKGYLFTNEDGGLMFYSTPYKRLKQILRDYNDLIESNGGIPQSEKEQLLLPNITLHGLRHTSATLLISQNIDVRTVSARLGHAQTSTTMNIYAHALKSLDRAASDALENVLNKSAI